MTEPPNTDQPDQSPATVPDPRKLRNKLLGDLVGDYLSLSHSDSIIAYDHATEPLAERQELLMTTIRSLLTDGLVVMGDIVGGTDATVDAWKVPLDEAMACLRERYVVHYDTWETWGWTTWFVLTEKGNRAAEAL